MISAIVISSIARTKRNFVHLFVEAKITEVGYNPILLSVPTEFLINSEKLEKLDIIRELLQPNKAGHFYDTAI